MHATRRHSRAGHYPWTYRIRTRTYFTEAACMGALLFLLTRNRRINLKVEKIKDSAYQRRLR